jgi:hypothetical protein
VTAPMLDYFRKIYVEPPNGRYYLRIETFRTRLKARSNFNNRICANFAQVPKAEIVKQFRSENTASHHVTVEIYDRYLYSEPLER